MENLSSERILMPLVFLQLAQVKLATNVAETNSNQCLDDDDGVAICFTLPTRAAMRTRNNPRQF